ncbi:homeobox protein siamois-like [Engystomops pustulosus]|uniref:homeobox protein siamois-like n=1 Tax=Engystomops pustulosus TaxID=76066 RepID=UPI003AFAFC2F
MDSELDQVLCTILSLEEDYPTFAPSMVAQETPTNTTQLFPGLFSSMETQPDPQYSLTLRETLLEIYNLVGIQQQAKALKNMDLQKPSVTVKTPSCSSSPTFNNASYDDSPSLKRKFHGEDNELCKKVRTEKDEANMAAPNNRCRRRTNYSKEQIAFLTAEFERNPYPDFNRRCRIGRHTGITEPRIQVWFQNRRARHLQKPNKSEEDNLHPKSTATEQICQSYNENPPNPHQYGAAPSADPSWLLPDLESLLY